MKLRKDIYIVVFFVSLTLFIFSLLDWYRQITDLFWIMTMVSAAFMVFTAVAIFYKPKEKLKLNARYERKKQFITRTEYNFLQTLKEISPHKYEVLPQVALLSVIEKKTNTSYRNELFRICDYCFVDKDTYEPLLLVELNDGSHKRQDRINRDEKVAAICADASLPLVTFWTDGDLSYSTVKKTIEKNILKS